MPAKRIMEKSTLIDVDNYDKCKLSNKKTFILVIVESPGKIKKISSILGDNYKVVASYGHIMDLHKKKLCVDIDNKFKPEYHIITDTNAFSDKTKVVNELRQYAKQSYKVIIASDDDREGEMIGWCYKVVIGLDDTEYERITFNSITKEEVKKAIMSPKKLDMNMVASQQTRRIIDRLVGFKISNELRRLLGIVSISAGRVQSVVVKLICEKEDEIQEFFEGENSSFYKITSVMNINKPMKCELYTDLQTDIDSNDAKCEDAKCEDAKCEAMNKAVINTYKEAHKLMQNIVISKFKIVDIIEKKSTRTPSPPYTTSTAQQDASSQLGFNISRTTKALQNLYEEGYTTYLRTDSTNLSQDALTQCEEYITKIYGTKYHNLKNYTNTKGNTQEAHEAIRPVDIKKTEVKLGNKIGTDEQKIYNLVWNRTIASQMKPAIVNVYSIIISISKEKHYVFLTKMENIVFDGYLIVYNTEVIEPFILPTKGTVYAQEIKATEDYKNPPLRYTEAGLIKKMDPKNLNIGRPATYGSIITNIQKQYVEIKDIGGIEKKTRIMIWTDETKEILTETKTNHIGREHKKFVPTELGKRVTTLLIKHFPDIMDYQFTANMEKELDDISEGTIHKVKCLTKFWKKFEPLLNNINKLDAPTRVIGRHPITNEEITAYIGYGGTKLKMNNKIVALPPSYTVDEITLDDAINLLVYPKLLGHKDDKKVELKKGKFGLYLSFDDKTCSIPQDVNPDDITLEYAMIFINNKYTQITNRIKKYLFYSKIDNIEYIIDSKDNSKYIMMRDVTKKTTKPLFVPFPDTEQIDIITVERIKEIIKNKPKKKYKKY